MSGEKTINAHWKGWSEDSEEDLVLKESEGGVSVESVITNKERFALKYSILCDAAWRCRSLKVTSGKKVLEIESDGLGAWKDSSGLRAELSGAIDIDISATPFTNTLPIRRLKLKESESAEVSVVYVTTPELAISLERQRYTCVMHHKRYRFESIGGSFVREIDVDEDGLVLAYPGLFKRI